MSRNQKIALGGVIGLFLLAIYYEPTLLVLVILGLGYYFLVHRPWRKQNPRRLAWGVLYAEIIVVLLITAALPAEGEHHDKAPRLSWYSEYLDGLRDNLHLQDLLQEQANQAESLTQQIEICHAERLSLKAEADALSQQRDSCQAELSNQKASPLLPQ